MRRHKSISDLFRKILSSVTFWFILVFGAIIAFILIFESTGFLEVNRMYKIF